MAYVDGYKLKMADGTTATVIPNKGQADIVVGPLSISITTTRKMVSVAYSFEMGVKGVQLPITRVTKARVHKPKKLVETVDTRVDAGVLRRCARCHGIPFCVTRGCLNIGCGWICDIEP